MFRLMLFFVAFLLSHCYHHLALHCYPHLALHRYRTSCDIAFLYALNPMLSFCYLTAYAYIRLSPTFTYHCQVKISHALVHTYC
ncbi:hypothetical protein DFH07DRAFT_805107 [Mycena maculata]|uniref:Secreted protein n=1 Tax=Mycena maculata TaxID=230809 RepID=A0AAD7JVH3_9AGAR|nr:hypothetical protein DFH07DRAFT_805107 [Mycena maculata]